MEKKTIGSFIAALRRANGLTQRQLAEKLCVSDKAVSRWERDEALPDLSIIPELADIFGVTADEILRGERRNPEASTAPVSDKGERLRKRLLAKKKQNYTIFTTISVGLSVIGLIAAMLINFCGMMSQTGFFVGTAFFAVSIILQLIAIISSSSDLDEEMVTEDERINRNEYVFKLATSSFMVTFLIFMFCLPLTIVGTNNVGVNADSWFLWGAVLSLVGVIIYLIAFSIVGSVLSKRRLIYITQNRVALHILRARFVRLGTLILVGLVIGQIVVSAVLPDLLKQKIRFDNWEDFKAFMETPTSTNDHYSYESTWVDVDVVAVPDESTDGINEERLECIYDSLGNVLCEYYPRNQNIAEMSYNIDNPENPNIIVYTRQSLFRAADIMDNIVMPAYCLLYPMAIVLLYLIYRKRRKTL